MDNTHEELIEVMAGLFLTLLGFTWFFGLTAFGNRYDKALIKETANKPSIVHSYAYVNTDRDFSSAEVISDILECDLSIKNNGTAISDDILLKAREGNASAIQHIKNTFSNATYKKTYEYSEDGEIIGLSFR